MKKYYKLKKDLPTFKAGDIFELRGNGSLYWCAKNQRRIDDEDVRHWSPDVMAYHSKTIAAFPEILGGWFEEIDAPRPLIKNTKFREALRAWAELNDVKQLRLMRMRSYGRFDGRRDDKVTLSFYVDIDLVEDLDLLEGRYYGTDELCGSKDGSL